MVRSPHPRSVPQRRRFPPSGLLIGVLVLCCSCDGPPGPMGPQGPPGDALQGTTHVARFDHPTDLQTWHFGSGGAWEVADGRLLVSGAPSTYMTVGPSTRFAHEVEISVEASWIAVSGAASCGIRFHVGPAGAYQFGVLGDGQWALRREDGEQRATTLLTGATGYQSPGRLRVSRRGHAIRLFINDSLVGVAQDPGLQEGQIQLFVEGQATVSFDNLWVGTALVLQ